MRDDAEIESVSQLLGDAIVHGLTGPAGHGAHAIRLDVEQYPSSGAPRPDRRPARRVSTNLRSRGRCCRTGDRATALSVIHHTYRGIAVPCMWLLCDVRW